MATFSSPQEAVAWMEGRCRAFATNPKEAEEALMLFRKSEHVLEVSKTIMEQSQVPMAQFHAALSLQEATLTRWEVMPQADRRALKHYLWEFISREWARLDRSVTSQVVRTFCVFWRRGWSVETDDAKMSLFALLERSSSEGGLSALRSAKTLNALVSEFGSTRATALGLPLAFSRRTHAAFDKLGLDQSMEMSMKLLGEVVTAMANPDALNNASVVELVTTVVNVCAEVLSWEFKFVEAWQIPPAQQLIRPGPRWRQYLVRPDFLGAVFDVYRRVRLRSTGGRGGTLPHSLRQLLLQLSSVHGNIFEGDSQQKAYASFLVEGATAVLASPLVSTEVGQPGAPPKSMAEASAEDAQADEYIGIASMAVRLVSNFKLQNLACLESFSAFAQQLAAIASRMLHQSTLLAGQEDGNPWREEVFGILLEAWVAMAQDEQVRDGGDAALRKGMEDATFPLYEQYLAYELTVSRVEAEAGCLSEEDEEEEGIGAADKDEQLCSVACLGRLSPVRALTAMDTQVRGVSEALSHLLETGSVNGQPALLPRGEGLSPPATGVMEQARTAVVLAAHLMADKDDGEAMVPEVLHASFLADNHAADALLKLVSSLLKLLELHVTLLGQGQQAAGTIPAGGGGAGGMHDQPSPLLSPYLGGALLWCFARWASPYLLPNLILYQGGQFNYGLRVAFGSDVKSWTLLNNPSIRDGDGGGGSGGGGGGVGGVETRGLTLVEGLLRACWTCLCKWPSQPDVCTNALDLMGVLVCREKASATTSLPLWWDIVAVYGSGGAEGGLPRREEGFRRLSVDRKGVLVQRLCEGVLQRAPDSATAKEGFDKVAGPVWTRLRGLLHAVGGLNGVQRQSPKVVAESLLCVRLCRGVVVACGSAGGDYHDLGETFVEPTYDGMALLLAMYVSGAPSVVYEVLQFFRDIAEQQLIYMSSRRAMALYEACGKALKIYADQHAGRVRRVDPTAEEDAYDDVLCVLELLSHLVTRDLLDASTEPESEKGREVVVTDVVFFGLKKIMPLMTEGLLQFPALASQYFSLVGFLVQTYAHKLAGLELELFEQVVNSLVFGSQQADAAVARNSLQAISVLILQHVAETMDGDDGLSCHLAVKPDLFAGILRALMQMLVFQHCVWDRLDACALAVLPLLTCEQEGFRRLAEEMVGSQPEQSRPRLLEAFQNLHTCQAACESGLTRDGRRRFVVGMREFVTSVRAFLQTK